MARLGARVIPVVAIPSAIYEGITLIDMLIPAQYKITTHIGNLRGQAGRMAPGGDFYQIATERVASYPEIADFYMHNYDAQRQVYLDTANQIELQALPFGDEGQADELTARMQETNRMLGRASSVEETDQILSSYEAESARQEAEFRAAQEAVPQVGPEAEENVRITGECGSIRICFWPRDPKYRRNPLRREYERQLRNQQDGINNMAPDDLVRNYDAFRTPAGRATAEAAARVSRPTTRTAYKNLRRRYLRSITPGTSSANPVALAAAHASVEARLVTHMRGLAALHNPDSIAGGNPTIIPSPTSVALARTGQAVPEMGHRGTNSSIGSLWNRSPPGTSGPTRAERLGEHARRQAAADCQGVQATLAICQGE